MHHGFRASSKPSPSSAAGSRAFAGACVVLLASMLAVQIGSIRQETPTWDEATELAAGYSYWKTHDYRMNRSHPPLWKLVSALPLLPMGLRVPVRDPSWRTRSDAAFGNAFLYHNRRDPDAIVFAARCMTIGLSLVFALVVALWTKRRAGPLAGAIALALVAFDPNLLAHGRYVTVDFAVTAFSFFACIAWNAALEKPAASRFALAGIAIGAAVTVKFSGLFVLPVCAILTILRPPPLRAAIPGFAVASAAIVAIVLACYRGAGSVYLDGLAELRGHAATGHLGYLLGTISSTGWWYYFPVVLAVKMPTCTVIALELAAVVLIHDRAGGARANAVLIVPLVVFAVAAVFSHIDIGIRHVLPMLPFLYAGIAIVLARRVPGPAIAVLIAGLALESLAVYPNYLAFFNAPAGGPANGPRYLLDSNIDWGQDTEKLRTWLRARGNPRVCGAYFGNAYPALYGIREDAVPASPAGAARAKCVVAVSVTNLYGLFVAHDRYRWLRAHEPVARIGYSIYVYDFRRARRL